MLLTQDGMIRTEAVSLGSAGGAWFRGGSRSRLLVHQTSSDGSIMDPGCGVPMEDASCLSKLSRPISARLGIPAAS
ncbi:hypothetical protein BOSE21B_111027 [Bosea sp. 21B]|nr:hypothetical protein BOSE21B_111027 [Bosea sp. 21B]